MFLFIAGVLVILTVMTPLAIGQTQKRRRQLYLFPLAKSAPEQQDQASTIIRWEDGLTPPLVRVSHPAPHPPAPGPSEAQGDAVTGGWGQSIHPRPFLSTEFVGEAVGSHK
jgi:hypothetical protein